MSEHDELVEKVARAICTSISVDEDEDEEPCTCGVDGGTCCAMDLFGAQARAALSAMPTAGDGWPSISPELIDKLNKLATYLTEQGEYEACDLIDTVVERLTPKAKG